MDPSEFFFDIKAYKRQSEIEERYIINRFKERRNKIEEDYPPTVKRKIVSRISERAHNSDASYSNSKGSNAHLIGRDAPTKNAKKKKGKSVLLKVVNEKWNEVKQLKKQELEQLEKINMRQEEVNQLMKNRIMANNMNMFMQLSEKEHLNDNSKFYSTTFNIVFLPTLLRRNGKQCNLENREATVDTLYSPLIISSLICLGLLISGFKKGMGSDCLTPEWASQPCLIGIDEAGRGPVLGPMVYGCMYCPVSYQSSLASLHFADSKTLKEEKREELYENLKLDNSLGWAVDVIDPRELSAKMLAKNKTNLNEISHNSAMGLIKRVLDMGVFLTEAYLDTVGDPEKYRIKLSERFPSIKFVVSKKADSLFPIVSGASIVAKVTRDRALREWLVEETGENINRNFGSGYPGDPETKAWLVQHKHSVFGFPSLVRFSWGTCTAHLKGEVEVAWEADETEESGNGSSSKRQAKLSSFGFKTCESRSEEIESSGKGRCKFFQARKIQQLTQF